MEKKTNDRRTVRRLSVRCFIKAFPNNAFVVYFCKAEHPALSAEEQLRKMRCRRHLRNGPHEESFYYGEYGVNIHYLTEADLRRPEIMLYNERAETQLYHYYEPEPGLFIAETPLVIERALSAGYEPVSMVGEEQILLETAAGLPSSAGKIPLYIGSHELLKSIAGYEMTKGLLCTMRRKRLPDMDSICAGASRIVILERVMNPINVGAIFRSAAALGMDGVLLTKGCSDPYYRRSSRVSMGNVFMIPWSFFRETMTPEERVGSLKDRGFFTAAMALTDSAVPLGKEDLSGHEKLAVFMGSEFSGLCEETVKACDICLKIPMKEGVDSLNVAAASAVAFWELGKTAKK